AAELARGPCPPALSARGAHLDLPPARLGLADAGPGAGGAAADAAGGGAAAGVGHRALWAVGDLYRRVGLAPPRVAHRLGGLALSLAQAAVHAHRLCLAAPGRRRLARRPAPATPAGRPRLSQPRLLHHAARVGLGLH